MAGALKSALNNVLKHWRVALFLLKSITIPIQQTCNCHSSPGEFFFNLKPLKTSHKHSICHPERSEGSMFYLKNIDSSAEVASE